MLSQGRVPTARCVWWVWVSYTKNIITRTLRLVGTGVTHQKYNNVLHGNRSSPVTPQSLSQFI